MDRTAQFSATPNLTQLHSSSTVDCCSTVKPSFKHSKCVFDVTKTKSKHYYALLIGAKARLPYNSINLKREFNLTEEQLRKIYLLPHTVTSEPYLKAFQQKVLNSILYTNNKLYKIGYTENCYCSFFNHENESLYHLMFQRPHSSKFWEAFELYILQVTNRQMSQSTRCSWSHLLKMPPAKLFDNRWQIVPVGLQKEWSSSQHNQLSSKSKYQITNRKIHQYQEQHAPRIL